MSRVLVPGRAVADDANQAALELHRPRFRSAPDWQVTTRAVMEERKQRSGPVEYHRSKPRWSANKKRDAILRLLRGEPLDQLSRELEVEPELNSWW